MDASELGRWTRFASKGGIGRCTALQDCVAEEPEDLMFMKDDEITVLMQLTEQEDLYLGFCEGVVGQFRGNHVRFHGRLKKPVMTKRSSMNPSASNSSSSFSRPSSSQSALTVAARDSISPSVPARASPAPWSSSNAGMPYNNSNSSLMTESSSLSRLADSSSSSKSSSIPLPEQPRDEGYRDRSTSYSSVSTALESVPSTPADFSHDIEENNIRILNRSRQASVESEANIGTPALYTQNQADQKSSFVRDNSQNGQLVVDEESDYHSTSQIPTQESFSYSSEPSTRISVALSDGEVGIGLSLLQDFVGGGDGDDAASITSRYGDTSPPSENVTGIARSSSPDSTIGHPSPSVRSAVLSESQYSTSPKSANQSLAEFQPPTPAYARESDVLSRNSMHPSMTDSDFGGSEWEGASDIYDNYRYSRFSMASKMSRYSKGSGLGIEVPPVPVEHESPRMSSELKNSRPSRDRLGSVSSCDLPSPKLVEARLGGVDVDPVDPVITATQSEKGKAFTQIAKGKPSPLNSFSDGTPSPLLHGSFGSPQGSLIPLSMDSFLPPGDASHTPNPIGAASALRQRLEQEREFVLENPAVRQGSESYVRVTQGERLPGQVIVVDDNGEEHHLQTTNRSADSRLPQPSTSNSTVSISEKRTMSPTLAAAEPAPPPYTAVPPTIVSSSSSSPASPSPPPLTLSHQGQPLNFPLPTTRPLNINRPPASPGARRSLFMPHPHAPKPAESPAGPMYGRHRQTTIYGRFEHDLASSIGPVPISFSLEPQMSIPANRPSVSQSLMASPSLGSSTSVSDGNTAAEIERIKASRPENQATDADKLDSVNRVIPRANFFPKAPAMRPRSRSFSGFDTPFTEVPLPKEHSHEEGNQPLRIPSIVSLTKRSKSATATPIAPVSVPSPQRATVSHASSVVRNFHAPSPLSLSRNNIVAAPPSPPLPSSPIRPSSRSTVTSPVPNMTSDLGVSPLDQTSRLGSSSTDDRFGVAPSGTHPLKATGVTEPDSSERVSLSTPRSPSAASGSLSALRHSRSFATSGSKGTLADLSRPRASSQGRKSGETEGKARNDLRVNVASPSPAVESPEPGSPFMRAGSSRSGLLLPTLRTHNGDSSSRSGNRSPTSTIFSIEHDFKTVQVQDMDFELVRPTIPQSPITANSVDSLSLSPPSPVREGASLAPSDDLIFPTRKSSSERPAVESKVEKPLDVSNIEAHRQRELRWISAMSSTPPSQARKSKKVRKLILEGVPASVRYLVWAHLTDSKAKRMDGLYTRLGQREKVAAIENIEHDSQQIFNDQPLQDQSLVNLLQAYLSMVPDIPYHRGLTVIASQLLIQSPEEDAFWTFISLMDTHIRPYFSLNGVQLEVDASLFAKAAESNDAILAKKIFVDMAISPMSICRPWFTSIFADSLPPEHLHRVWDVFLFEGVPFLLRVGLAIFTCCRQMLLQCTGQDTCLSILSRPPLAALPANPDAFIEVALSTKLKDEDFRKQRSKIEAQVKRQTQSRTPSTVPLSSAPISLPRT
ncbi:hypothetical protein AcV5_003953 [Taiwanofungus camphoratus]|nr:hypothetical protein AcV5_003953 [Antrodia cinnamomea]